MHLARVWRRSSSNPEVVVRVAEEHEDRGGDRLLPLRSVLGKMVDDPVAVAMMDDLHDLSLEVKRLDYGRRGHDDLLYASEVAFDVPAPTCSKVCCMALNYADHAAESNLALPDVPVLFFKPPSSLVGHGAKVIAPSRTAHLEHEVELAVIIGKQAKDLSLDNWYDSVAGYTVLNDITARDLQLANIARNVPWDQSKGFDTFAPTGPYLVTKDEIPDPHDLRMTLSVAGEVRQAAHTGQMVFDIPTLMVDLSNGMTMMPGDIIATGTTAGIAPLKDGDTMFASVSGIGTLVNSVEFTK